MQFMSQISHSPKLVSFFAKYILSEILTLPEKIFCHVEIIFLLSYRNYGAKDFKKQVCNPGIVSQNCKIYFHQILSKICT